MRSLNRVMLIGHLAADPELRQTKSGHTVTTFPVATNRFSKSESGEKRSIADFHRVVAWEKLGEICSDYLQKGMAVYLDGRIVNSSYEDKNGVRQYRTEIMADGLNILTWKKSRNGVDEVAIEEVDKEKEAVPA